MKYINTNIEASCILMQNVAYTCATVSNQSKSKKYIYFYLIEIAPEKKVSLIYINK
jgi:hypothetical protein